MKKEKYLDRGMLLGIVVKVFYFRTLQVTKKIK